MNKSNPFEGLDGGEFDADLAANDAKPAAFDPAKGMLEQGFSKAKIAKFEQPCKPCKGGGKFISWTGRVVGECYRCSGTGVIFTKTDPKVLKAKRDKVVAKRHAAAKQNAEAAVEFLASNQPIHDWFTVNLAKDNEFAQSLFNQLTVKGSLSAGQIGAIEKSIAREAEWAAERAAKDAAMVVNSSLHDAFEKAQEAGLKKPSLRIDGYRFSLAPARGVNAGCIYAKADNGDYLGKINQQGKFFSVRDCPNDAVEFVNTLGGDLLERAVQHGKDTGECSCCGRQLTDPKSIEQGIGPVCYSKWFQPKKA